MTFSSNAVVFYDDVSAVVNRQNAPLSLHFHPVGSI